MLPTIENIIQIEQNKWTPTSWQKFPLCQQPRYEDTEMLLKALSKIKKFEPFVSVPEIEMLKKNISLASEGKHLLIQAGDCAESFSQCNEHFIQKKLKFYLSLKEKLKAGLALPVSFIGRIAGQFAKPRTELMETKHGVTFPSYQGDSINLKDFDENSRKANPFLLLQAALLSSKVSKILQENSSIYTSHEALLLCYESALTRFYEAHNAYYNTSAHLVWLGERTRYINGAHVEYLRGICNPIGIKLSHNVTNFELGKLVKILNPNNEKGKIILIPRLGVDKIDEHLPRLIDTVQKSKLNVAWICDPMHGNGVKTSTGFKTRDFDKILNELLSFTKIVKRLGAICSGLHLEISPENVTECLGGSQKITEGDVSNFYTSSCDPRLNYLQSFEILEAFIDEMRR